LLLPSDDFSYGFNTIARTLQPIPDSVYATAAERVTELAFGNLATRQLLLPCPAATADDVPRCTQHLSMIAARAFRRPLSEAETSALVDVYKTKPAPFCCFVIIHDG
jgi:hypothetical protein